MLVRRRIRWVELVETETTTWDSNYLWRTRELMISLHTFLRNARAAYDE